MQSRYGPHCRLSLASALPAEARPLDDLARSPDELELSLGLNLSRWMRGAATPAEQHGRSVEAFPLAPPRLRQRPVAAPAPAARLASRSEHPGVVPTAARAAGDGRGMPQPTRRPRARRPDASAPAVTGPTHAWQVWPPRARHAALLPVACARVRGRAAARGAHLGGGGAAAWSDCPGSQLGTHAAHPPHQGPARLLRAASFRPERERPRHGDAKERLRRERPVALAPAQSRRARCLLTSQALQAYRDTSLVSPLPRLWLAAGRRRELRAAGVRSHVRGGGGGRGTGRGAGRARRAGRGGSSVRLQTL